VKIAVVGGTGAMGSGIVKDLLSKNSKGVENVIVTSRDAKRVHQFISELKDDRLEAAVVDPADTKKLSRILQKADACANAAQYTVNLDCMEACLEAGCQYLDLGGLFHTTLKQKKLHKKFADKGVAAILGLGSAPGTTNVLAKYTADQLDTVEKINLYDAIKVLGPESSVFIPPYSISTILEEYTVDSVQFIDGEFKTLPACSGKQVITFPEPLGSIECFHTLHSEPATLPYTYKDKGIKEATWRLGQPPEVKRIIYALVSVGFGILEPLQVKDTIVNPIEFLNTLIQRNAEKNKDKVPKPKFIEETQPYEILRAVVEGKKEDKEVKYTVDLIREPNELYEGFIDSLTSMPASIGAQTLARGEIPPGVWAPEECIDTTKFFGEMTKRKFKINVKREEEWKSAVSKK